MGGGERGIAYSQFFENAISLTRPQTQSMLLKSLTFVSSTSFAAFYQESAYLKLSGQENNGITRAISLSCIFLCCSGMACILVGLICRALGKH